MLASMIIIWQYKLACMQIGKGWKARGIFHADGTQSEAFVV